MKNLLKPPKFLLRDFPMHPRLAAVCHVLFLTFIPLSAAAWIVAIVSQSAVLVGSFAVVRVSVGFSIVVIGVFEAVSIVVADRVHR